MMKWLLPVLVLLSFSSAVWASEEDDLLSILNSEAGDSIVKEKDDLTDALRAYLKTPTAAQNQLFELLTASKYQEALENWEKAFGNTSFNSSATGQALKAYLQFQSGLQLNGIRNLFAISEPRNVSPEVKKIWNLTLTSESKIWAKLRLEWKPAWTEFFNSEIEAKVLSWQVYDPTDTERILSLISNTKLNTPERNWLEWQMALGLALQGDSTKAGKVLAHMLKSPQKVIGHDLINATVGRLLFEKGFLTPAIAYYKKVPKKSEYWFEAQEEIAWSYMRKGEPQNTLAVSQSQIIPAFSAFVGPELIFLRAFAQLKVCDYPETILAVRAFKTRFKPRMQNLMALEKDTNIPAVKAFIAQSKKGRVNSLDLKDNALYLPRFLARDEVTYNLIEQMAQLEKENKVARKLSKKVEGETMKAQKALAQARLEESKTALSERIRLLAQAEIAEIEDVLKKMHIVEAEVIQQVNLAKRVEPGQKVAVISGTTGSQNKYSMTFPYEGEVWFDEIDSYKVDVKKNCRSITQ